ncbi:Isoprenylcysteine carboxyl methyltransferase [Candidatus Sulfopaludibacter sp. SbA4]|nr:Isoprenylcysteine carboxyl methyltransferase [Candidatus Sulfopaludibacter sp. SbA4]
MQFDSQSLTLYAWMAFCIVWLISAFTNKRTTRRQPIGSLIVHVCVLGLAFDLLFSSLFRRGLLRSQFLPDTATVGWSGIALTVAGIVLAIWARFHIGRNWSGFVTLKEGHTLTRTGPYAIVRHPIYTGLLLAVLGTAIVHREVGGLIAFALLVVEWKRKSLLEERFMIEQFRAEYLEYRREVKGLIPFVW